MMPTAIHAFSQEEIMAYFDGELAADRALAVAQHLEQCRECQTAATEMRSLSQRLGDWTIEPTTSVLPQVAPKLNRNARWGGWPFAWIAAAAMAAALVLVVVRAGKRTQAPGMFDAADVAVKTYPEVRAQRGIASSGEPAGVMGGVVGGVAPPPPVVPQAAGPLIVRTARLSIVSNNFEQSRAEIERITRLHLGYLAELQLTTPERASRNLNSTLRVPAAQLDPLLQDLRKLGSVRDEWQQAEDVTQHFVDVNARLSNLRTTEGRLLQMLRERTGKLADILQVEEAVDRTRGDIETTEAEQKSLSGQIAFASVQLTVSEEYQAPLEGNDSSAMTRLRNAAVEGYRNAVEGTVGVLAFLLSTLPGLLIVVAVAFYPARWSLRKWREGGRRLTGT